jgi:transketolase
MGSITNGMVLHGGLVPYSATFLAFSDYMRPSIRMAALMKIPTIFIFTHDSVALGEDGPTHQPIEQLMSLRLIPNLTVIRPCDANEVAQAWQIALKKANGPTCTLLTRQPVPILDPINQVTENVVSKGAYVISKEQEGQAQAILIATGSEVHLALSTQALLSNKGIATRGISMPSWELFLDQPIDYQQSVLLKEIKHRFAIEAGATSGWEKWVGDHGAVFGINQFGASAPCEELLNEFGFTPESISAWVMTHLDSSEST